MPRCKEPMTTQPGRKALRRCLRKLLAKTMTKLQPTAAIGPVSPEARRGRARA